ncbi:phage head spike fiber domain-containing protein [Flavobacterium sp. N2820]|uniref:phage head spike fiber domain-containing protein n=1 Tax=Flavobacterium sp. N2820 TaxID=2986834 RepID=UPI0022243417|nr:hypothetical protein [Flavobacterium sp. N2820]
MSLIEQASLVITPNAVKASKLYAIKPFDGTGDLAVVRATTATRVNKLGLIEQVPANVARLNYKNSSCPSILVEPLRTNLFTYSQDFTNAIWIKLGSIFINPNSGISPSGNNDASLITNNNISDFISQIYNGSTGVVYTFSVFIKNNNAERSSILVRNTLNALQGLINWNGSELTSISGVSGGSITYETLSNGWYRLIGTFTSVENAIRPRFSSDNINVGRSVFLWGAQLEAAANATSYIPTITSAVTRNADVISKTGIADLIGQTEGVVFVDMDFQALSIDNGIISIGDGGIANRIFFSCSSSNLISVVVRNSTGFQYSFSLAESSGRKKIALSYKNNDFDFFINGVLINSSNSGVLPLNISSLSLSVGNTSSKQNYINKILLWKTKLTDEQCISLTTL